MPVLIASACARPPLPSTGAPAPVSVPFGRFLLEFADGDKSQEPELEKALAAATPHLEAWGGLLQPVHVVVVPDHRALEEAADKKGFSWLRAWARYDEVFVQSPRTWGPGRHEVDLDILLLHELVHCLMYQRSATRTDWRHKEIPLWFREGMASYTANQGYRLVSLEDLARWLDTHPAEDPLQANPALYREHDSFAYGAALHAFAFLVKRYGRGSVLAVIDNMRLGSVFSKAFFDAVGLPVDSFSGDFKRYLQSRGFRDERPTR